MRLGIKDLHKALNEAGLTYSEAWLWKKLKQKHIILPKDWNGRYKLTPELIKEVVESVKKTGKWTEGIV